ncbi:MAG: type IV toxin-antitoxin system AbiEi family antitoxin domain-containing protein [Rhodoglobus sp.]
MSLDQHFSSHRPIVSTSDLIERGLRAAELTAAVRSGDLWRVRRGQYCLPGTTSPTVTAVRVGGLLTCTTALRSYGVWMPDDPSVHVWMPRNASRMRSPRDRWLPLTDQTSDGVELHWWPLSEPPATGSGRVGLADALGHAVRCAPRPIAIAAIDSVLNARLLDSRAVESMMSALPRRYRGLLTDIDGRSMSGIETILRLALRDAGLSCEVQVRVSGVGRVDLVVEGCIAIETDGRSFHEGAETRARDYDRDLKLTLAGYTVLRFDYRQIMFELESVVQAVRVALVNRAGRAVLPAR